MTGGYEKVFHVTNHQGRSHLEPQRTSPCMTLSKNKTLSAGEGMGVGTQEGAGTVKQNNHYWNHLPSNPVYLAFIAPHKLSSESQRDVCIPCWLRIKHNSRAVGTTSMSIERRAVNKVVGVHGRIPHSLKKEDTCHL